MEEAGVKALWGEPGYTFMEREGARPTIDFNGLWGGFQGDGTKTVTPAEAHLKVTSRLVADQDPGKIAELIRNACADARPGRIARSRSAISSTAPRHMWCRGTIPCRRPPSGYWPSNTAPAPVIVRSGGSVPITATFKRLLGLDTITIGFGLPGCHVHAPNEWFREIDFDRAREIYAAYLGAF